MLLEGRDGVEDEFVVGGDYLGGAGDGHGGEGFVGFEEVLFEGAGEGDEVRFEVFGVAD